MPPKRKKEISMSILSLMLGVIVTGVMGWMGVELIKSHDDNIKSQHIAKQLDEISIDNKALIARHDELLRFMNDNKLNIKIVDTKLEERFLSMFEKVNYNANQITYLKGRLKGVANAN